MAVDSMAPVDIEVVEPVFSPVPLESAAEVETEEAPAEAVEANDALMSMGLGRNLDTVA